MGDEGVINYSVAYEETQLNRVSDFCDFACSLCFQRLSFFFFYFYKLLCGMVHKSSPGDTACLGINFSLQG